MLNSEYPLEKIGEQNFDTQNQGAAVAMAHYSACGIVAHKPKDEN
jgi:hypothetical protein